MPTVLRLGNIRVVIYSNDHSPPHVHAIRGDAARTKFNLNCPAGPVELVEQEGFKIAEIRKIGEAIANDLIAICTRWSEIHGAV